MLEPNNTPQYLARQAAANVMHLWVGIPDVVVSYLTTGAEELRLSAYEACMDADRIGSSDAQRLAIDAALAATGENTPDWDAARKSAEKHATEAFAAVGM